MENFFYDDYFCDDIGDLIYRLFDDDEEEIRELPNDWTCIVQGASLQKIFEFKLDFIVDAIVQKTDTWEDRFPEESDDLFKKIESAIKVGINVNKINSELPSLYYPNGNKLTITKQELIDYIL